MSKHEPVSAMLEALREIANCSQVLQGSVLDDPNANAKNAAKRYAGMIQEIAESAMRLPLRNCDRFKTAAEALNAYQDKSNNALSYDEAWNELVCWLYDTAEGGK